MSSPNNYEVSDLINMIKNFEMSGSDGSSQKRRKSLSVDEGIIHARNLPQNKNGKPTKQIQSLNIIPRVILSDSSDDCDKISLHGKSSMEDIINYIFRIKLQLTNIPVDNWVEIFNSNLILNLDILCKQEPDTINRLNLPIALETEVKKLIVARRNDNLIIEKYDDLTQDIKERIKKSWNTITKKREKLNALFDEFYKLWFQTDKNAVKLFGDATLEQKSKKLLMIMGLAIKYVDQPKEFNLVLEKISVMHLIHGINKMYYDLIAKVLSDVIYDLLGPSVIDNNIRNGWCFIIKEIGYLMNKNYETIKSGKTCVLYLKKHKKWYKCYCKMTHELLLFAKYVKNEYFYEINLKDITNIDYVDDDDTRIIKQTPYCFKLCLYTDDIFICVDNSDAMEILYEEIKLRINALQSHND